MASDSDASESLPLNPVTDQVVQILVENHRRFHAFLAKRLNDERVAEDVLQQSFKKALETPPSSTQEATVLAWFYQTLKNAVIDHYRKNNRESLAKDVLFHDQVGLGLDRENAPDEWEAEICACLNALLPTLKPEYADLVRKVDFEGVSLDQLARELGITQNNATVRLHRARQALRVSLERTCGTCTEHGCLDCSCE